jgi:hypothetical protein
MCPAERRIPARLRLYPTLGAQINTGVFKRDFKRQLKPEGFKLPNLKHIKKYDLGSCAAFF